MSGEFEFPRSAAELHICGMDFDLALNADTMERLRAAAETLARTAKSLKTERELTEAVLDAADEAVGEPFARDVMALKPGAGFFDALELFRYICSAYAAAWRERTAELTRKERAPVSI
jgi:hypothetical protein